MIVFDLDGCLANCEHRRHFVDPPEEAKYIYTDSIPHKNGCILTGHYEFDGKKWQPDNKSFYEACDDDTPIQPVCNVLSALMTDTQDVEIWSGRCESVRKKTEDWFEKHIRNIYVGWNFELKLKMRPIGDSTPIHALKERWLNNLMTLNGQYIPTGEGKVMMKRPVDFVFDSDPKSIEIWRRRGIFVFDCNQTGDEF